MNNGYTPYRIIHLVTSLHSALFPFSLLIHRYFIDHRRTEIDQCSAFLEVEVLHNGSFDKGFRETIRS